MDVRIVTFPNDPAKAGMIYYDIEDMRPNEEILDNQAKIAVVTVAGTIVLTLAPGATGGLVPVLQQCVK